MKTYKILKRGILAVLVIVGMSACDSGFQQINKNPNSPTSAPATMTLPDAEHALMNQVYDAGMNMYVGGIWVQQYAKIQYTEEDRYDLSGRANMINNDWDNLYRVNEDLKKIEEQAKTLGNDNVVAIAEILTVYNYQNMTDLWGPIPYSQALQGDASTPNVQPKYDSQKDVYTALIARIKAAAAMINPSKPSIGNQDLIYSGDMTKWKKLANSLELRLYMRLSNVDPGTAEAGVKAVLQNGNLITSNDDNAGFHYKDYPYQNPVGAWYNSREDFKISITMADTLKSLNDPRLPVYAIPVRNDSMKQAGDKYEGVQNGAANNSKPLGQVSDIGAYFIAPSCPGWLMTASEVKFFMAEAAIRGWYNYNGKTASQLYNDAIKTSMQQFTADRLNAVLSSLNPSVPIFGNLQLDASEFPTGVTQSQITNYLAQPSVQLSGSQAQQLKQLAEQEWIALYGQGFEAWTEYRRNGFTTLKPGPLAVLNQVPTRLTYPDNEQTLNSTNYQAAKGMLNGGDALTGTFYWEK